MAFHRYTPEQCKQAYDLVVEHGSAEQAARASGDIDGQSIRRRYLRYIQMAERGELGTKPVIPGFRIAKVTNTPNGDFIQQRPAAGEEFKLPAGHVVKGVSALVDSDGRELIKWVKTKQGELDLDQVAVLLRETFDEIKGRAPTIPTPKKTEKRLLAVYPLIDWHVGLLSWARETGEDYDLKIARTAIMSKMAELIAATPAADEAVILGIGDMMHFDGYDPVTPASKHQLDSDSRYPKVLATACDMVEQTIELALAKHRHVTVRILPGNHDPVSSLALTLALSKVFRGNKRVTLDDSPSYFWWFRREKVFLGGTHGDKTKMADAPLVMAHDRPEDWAASSYRRIYTGHFHSERRIEQGGVIVTCMRSPVAKDAYHSFNKWRSGRSVYSETFCLDGSEAATLTFNL